MTEQQQQEQQKLQKGKSYITVVGTAKVTDKTFAINEQSKHSDYQYSRMGLGIETVEGNVVFGEMMGGFSPSMNYPIKAKTKLKDGESGKAQSVEINWADRLNESIVETIRDYDTIRIGLIRDGEEPAEGQEDKRKLIVKKFLSAYDAIDYIQENLKDGMKIMAKGSYKFSKYKEEDQKKFEIESIFLSRSEEGFANFVQTIILDEDSVSKASLKDAKETGEIIVSARAVDYVGKINGKKVGKNMTFDLPITVKIDKENPALTEAIISKFFKVKKGKVREITIEGQILEGYEQSQVSEKDVQMSKDIQELIAMGLYSKEEAMEKVTVRGNKVSKLLFTRPFIQKDKEDAKKILLDINDDKYVPEDLFVEIEEEKEEEKIDLNSLADEEEKSNAGDNSWLAGLGLGQ
ncbi:hypothetical protein [Peribacillus asahii]|uniref:hypothetical protein n=1 Tax=Peribacillus asahii TaxID=228899 RepID=UPI00382491CF